MANSIKLNEIKKYHFIYKTTNLLNGRYYIGMHSTNNIDDGYLGSGTRLRRSVRKYGKENFKCEILEYCDTFDLVKQREREIVTDESIKDELCMNLKPGGLGGLCNESHKIKFQKAGSISGNKKIKWLWENDTKYINDTKIKNGLKNPNGIGFNGWWVGKKQNEETKKKIGLSNSIKQKGCDNSQFGKRWITNGIENKKIHKDESIPENWKIGRVIKK